jgi:5-methylcytosine-specific restriction endonuclease McrA
MPRTFVELTEQEYVNMGGNDVTSKVCKGCEKELDLSEYYNKTSNPDGLHELCKWCCKVSRAMEGVRKRDRQSKISVRQRVRAMGLGLLVDRDIMLDKVFKKARGICYLCKEWVQPKHASMDHEKPLVNGGTHSHGNVRLTHYKCNLRKGRSDPDRGLNTL